MQQQQQKGRAQIFTCSIFCSKEKKYIHILGKESSLYKHPNLTPVHSEPFETRMKTQIIVKLSNQTVRITNIK